VQKLQERTNFLAPGGCRSSNNNNSVNV